MPLIPTYTRWPIAPIKGDGVQLWDETGRVYLDFTSGIGVVSVGHRHPKVVARVEAQLHKLWHVSNLFIIRGQEQLAKRLAEKSHLKKAFFCNSGAEANEAAIKLARKVASEQRGIAEPEIITFTQSFHGRTLATLTATGQDKVKDGFAPLPSGFRTVTWGEITELEQAMNDNTAAVMLEVVQGEGGIRPAERTWLQRVAQLCRERNVLLIVDEVQTGMGRTGSLFAFQQYDIEPDLMTLAKSLGNGFPIGCLLATDAVSEHFGPGSHGSTFGGNPLAVEAGHGVLDVLEQPGFLDDVREKGEWFKDLLRRRLANRPLVRDVRGLGLMLGIVLEKIEAAQVIQESQQKGLLVLPAGTGVVRLLPPLTVSREQLTEAADILSQVFQDLEEMV